MELQEFVHRALVQISNGVEQAQNDLKESDAIINPDGVVCSSENKEYATIINESGDERLGFLVDFDIAVAASEGVDTKSGMGIVVVSLGFGTQHQSTEASNSYSRLNFRIPFFLPRDKKYLRKENVVRKP